MKRILVLGAGKSAGYLIDRLLRKSVENDTFVTVGDIDVEQARAAVGDYSRGDAVFFDVNEAHLRNTLIGQADVVINLLAPQFLDHVAWECLRLRRPMLSVSYADRSIRELAPDAQREGVLILCELGLDPGIDHMSAMALLRRLRADGGRVTSFCSYGSGVPDPDQEQNPLRYAVTWNPRNVAMSGEWGAQYMEDGLIKIVPHHHVFHHTWRVDVDSFGVMEAYPNRDSLSYMEVFGLEHVRTMIRGTLRWPGWSETWAQIVQLGLPNERLRIPGLAGRSPAEVVEMFLPLNASGLKLETRVARFLGISPTGRIMENLRWLGLFDDRPCGCSGDTASAMLAHLLQGRLTLGPDQRDAVVLVHELEVEYPGTDRRAERVTATMVARGEAGGHTAMAKSVGLPTALAAELLLSGELPLTGVQLPTHPTIYEPILAGLAAEGLAFGERTEELG